MKDSDDEIVVEEEADMGPAALKKLREKLALCVKEKQEYLEGWQRARADHSNAQRMFDEDKKAMRSSGMIVALEALLPALDSLEHARKAGDIPSDFVGIERQIKTAFMGLGVMQIAPAPGDDFDLRTHEALMEEPVENTEQDGKITKILETGWQTGEQVIRPAKVAVGVYSK